MWSRGLTLKNRNLGMMKIKLLILPLFVIGTMSGIYFLPRVGKVADSAVRLDLPDRLDTWTLEKIPPSEAELGTLSKDTRFSKARCISPRPGEINQEGYLIPDLVDLSIVLSGADINNSIHRPERCMPAQGHNITSSSSRNIALADGRLLPTKRLVSVQRVPKNAARTEYLKFNCVTYYFFVGHDQLTNDHLGRTFIDMKDRLLRGMDQRWAYVSASMWYGNVPWIDKEVSEVEANEKLTNYLRKFAAEQINWEQVAR